MGKKFAPKYVFLASVSLMIFDLWFFKEIIYFLAHLKGIFKMNGVKLVLAHFIDNFVPKDKLKIKFE